MAKAKRPLIIMGTDPHLNLDNIIQVQDLFTQLFDKALELGLKQVFVLGDIFDARKAQSLTVLLAFEAICQEAEEKGITIFMFPGNHDKLDYTSEDSYLNFFRHYPNVRLVMSVDKVKVSEDVTVHLLPFFEEKSVCVDYIKSITLTEGAKNYLLTHIGINGVKNNDGTTVEGSLSKSLFSKFVKIFVGHYHNRSQVGKNIFYIGSMAQNNFGEDPEKGFTVLYDNGSHELIESKYQKYDTISIDMDETSIDDLQKLRDKYSDNEHNIKFKITGPKEKVKSVEKHLFEEVGINIQVDYKDPEIDVSYEEAVEFDGFDGEIILEEFQEFSESITIDQEKGEELLKQALSANEKRG